LFICFVEFFVSVSSLKKEDWEKVSEFECEKDFEWRIRVCRLSFRWVFCVRERSFRLWILWFDFDSFFAVCVWICCVFDFFFDFRKFREWESIVCVVLSSEKKRIWDWKRNFFYFVFVCLLFCRFRRSKICSFLFFQFLN
jgi:hypothetical protein